MTFMDVPHLHSFSMIALEKSRSKTQSVQVNEPALLPRPVAYRMTTAIRLRKSEMATKSVELDDDDDDDDDD